MRVVGPQAFATACFSGCFSRRAAPRARWSIPACVPAHRHPAPAHTAVDVSFPACGVRRATAWTNVPPDARRRPWCGQRPHRGPPDPSCPVPPGAGADAEIPGHSAMGLPVSQNDRHRPLRELAVVLPRSGMASPRRRCLHGKGSAQPPSADRHATKSANAAVSPSIVSPEPRRCPCECRRAQRTPRRRFAATFRWAVALRGRATECSGRPSDNRGQYQHFESPVSPDTEATRQ